MMPLACDQETDEFTHWFCANCGNGSIRVRGVVDTVTYRSHLACPYCHCVDWTLIRDNAVGGDLLTPKAQAVLDAVKGSIALADDAECQVASKGALDHYLSKVRYGHIQRAWNAYSASLERCGEKGKDGAALKPFDVVLFQNEPGRFPEDPEAVHVYCGRVVQLGPDWVDFDRVRVVVNGSDSSPHCAPLITRVHPDYVMAVPGRSKTFPAESAKKESGAEVSERGAGDEGPIGIKGGIESLVRIDRKAFEPLSEWIAKETVSKDVKLVLGCDTDFHLTEISLPCCHFTIIGEDKESAARDALVDAALNYTDSCEDKYPCNQGDHHLINAVHAYRAAQGEKG